MGGPVVTVCIATRSGSRQFPALIASLRRQADQVPTELIVVSRDPVVLETAKSLFPGAVVALAAGTHAGQARNFAVRKARGELLWFLDDDVTIPPGALTRLALAARRNPEVAVFGGPNLTPPGASFFQRVQGAALASTVGSGPVRRRYGRRAAAMADERFFILCNLAIRRREMRLFPADVLAAEENTLLCELERRGCLMRYDPQLAVYHERRPTVLGFVRQILKYGFGRGQVIRLNPRDGRLSYLVPSAFLAYIGLVALWAQPGILESTPLVCYAAAVLAQATKIGVGFRSAAAALFGMVLIATMHLSYGSGVLVGLVCGPRPRPDGRVVLKPADQAVVVVETGPV